MGYFDYLKQMLRPLGIYDLNSGAGVNELFVIGQQLDEIFSELELLAREMVLTDALSFGVESYEKLFLHKPAFITTEDERRALMALLRIREGCFSLGLLGDTISGCGINAQVEEGELPQTAIIKFPQNRGIPEGFSEIKNRIEQILPCHLGIEYFFIYALWAELMAAFGTWGAIESRGLTWGQVEIFE